MYRITQYTLSKAKKLGVTVRPSTNTKKKIDVIKHGKTIASVGALGMMDYPTYIQQKGLSYAKTRRRLYRIRHNNDLHKKGTPGYYANQLLW
jgi:hypothetical protein